MDMEAHNKAKEIILASSKHSDFYAAEEEKLREVREKVDMYRKKVDDLKNNKPYDF